MAKVKITVVRRTYNEDLVDEYLSDTTRAEGYGICSAFRDGQEFIVEGTQMPEGFCSWAWGDIQREFLAMHAGGNLPWINQEGCGFACCTDAFRPVIFKLERISE